jgi:hypothetical protein
MSVIDNHKNLPKTVFNISKSPSLKILKSKKSPKKFIKSPHIANLGKDNGVKHYVDNLLKYHIEKKSKSLSKGGRSRNRKSRRSKHNKKQK